MQLQTFQNQFFAQGMTQFFNGQVERFYSDENETALHKWMKAHNEI